jgi:hypothetical protein
MKVFFLFFLLIFSVSLQAGDELLLSLKQARQAGDFQKILFYQQILEKNLSDTWDRFDRKSLKKQLYIESVPLPPDIFYDSQIAVLRVVDDDIWLGSRSGDIARYSFSSRRWTSLVRGQESLSIKSVQEILPQGERIWFSRLLMGQASYFNMPGILRDFIIYLTPLP